MRITSLTARVPRGQNQIMRIVLAFLFAFVAGCASEAAKQKAAMTADRQHVKETLGPEISLKSDREQLDTLRKDIPEKKKAANDELAFFLNQTTELKEPPTVLRERFQSLVQKKRSRFNEDVDRLRKNYDRDEKRRRDDFSEEQSDKRDRFKRKSKPSSEQTRQFFSDLDKERLDFYSREHDRRKDFEDEIKDQSANFNAYMKERSDEFVEQMRLYGKRFEEAKKKKPVEAMPPEPTPAQTPDLGR